MTAKSRTLIGALVVKSSAPKCDLDKIYATQLQWLYIWLFTWYPIKLNPCVCLHMEFAGATAKLYNSRATLNNNNNNNQFEYGH